MKASSRRQRRDKALKTQRRPLTSHRTRLVSALVAGSACALGTVPAQAVQLGEIDVHSSLGQPLRASIAFALSPNERIGDYCIYLRRAPLGTGLPSLSNAKLTVANGRINIAGRTPIREPMLDIGLSINCPYTANLTRFYTVMLDPYEPSSQQAPAPVVTARPEVAIQPAATPNVAQRRSVDTRTNTVATRTPESPVAAQGEYLVKVGDSLSEIASRIEDRPVGLWAAVDLLFAANPHAFIDGDINKLKAGSLLTIPAFDGVTAPQVAEVRDPASAQDSASVDIAYPGATETAAPVQAAIPVETAAPADTATVAEVPEAVETAPQSAPTELNETPVEVERLVTAEPEPVSPIAASETAQTEAEPAESTPDSSRTTLYWLAGTGFVLILMLLVFGRRMRSRFAAPPPAFDDSAAEEQEPATEEQQAAAETEIDFDIGEQPSTEYAVALDADLSAGTGLSDGGEMEVAQDFGFSAKHEPAGELDMTLSEDTTIEEKPSTDVLPARKAEATILEKEILPSDEDDDYDMSVIVDATKQRFGDGDITAKDLMAVAIAETNDEDADDEYTLSREVDYKILEQDYEDELTATQALNAEIEKAAKDLANTLDDDDSAIAEGTVETLAITAETNALEEASEPEIITDLDDTGINEELTAEMPTQGVSVADATVEMPQPQDEECTDDTAANTEITEKLPAAENDPTAEMDVESGHFRTGQGASSSSRLRQEGRAYPLPSANLWAATARVGRARRSSRRDRPTSGSSSGSPSAPADVPSSGTIATATSCSSPSLYFLLGILISLMPLPLLSSGSSSNSNRTNRPIELTAATRHS